jgi:hypothetical protein
MSYTGQFGIRPKEGEILVGNAEGEFIEAKQGHRPC